MERRKMPHCPRGEYAGWARTNLLEKLPVGHFLSHVEDKFAVFVLDFAQQAAQFVEKSCFFAYAPPGDIVGRFSLGKIRELRRLFAVIEELIEWAFESACHFFQRFNGRNGVSIFHA